LTTQHIFRNNLTWKNVRRDYNNPQPTPQILVNNLFDTGDPKITNPSTNNFRLQSSSAAIDNGVAINGLTGDSEGTLRPQGAAYDIGAYEYAVSKHAPRR
jgi:hypothetical protein